MATLSRIRDTSSSVGRRRRRCQSARAPVETAAPLFSSTSCGTETAAGLSALYGICVAVASGSSMSSLTSSPWLPSAVGQAKHRSSRSGRARSTSQGEAQDLLVVADAGRSRPHPIGTPAAGSVVAERSQALRRAVVSRTSPLASLSTDPTVSRQHPQTHPAVFLLP